MPETKGGLAALDPAVAPSPSAPTSPGTSQAAASHAVVSQAVVSQAGTNQLFLREEEIRAAQDLLFFAYRDFTNAADVILEELGLGRAHHRALHFIGRNPAISVTDLLTILRITKQSLARVLVALIDEGYVAQTRGRADRRQRLLTLTPAGQALERRLFERQRERLAAAYREAGGTAVEGFRRVMRSIMDDTARRYLDQAERGPRGGRGR
jgi:DNA-binding MarR family transcriptional regulator